MSKACKTCWHCQPGTPWKGYCHKWYISVEYGGGCEKWKEASDRRKKQIADMQNMLINAGFVEIAPGMFQKKKERSK